MFKIFISSRNNDQLMINGVKGDSLTEIRKFLKKEIEAALILGRPIFDVRINEDFAADTSENSYNKCLEEAKGSDFCIALYNGAAGWAPKGVELGICHAEFDAAISVSTKKVAVIDISEFYDLKGVKTDEKKRNKKFFDYLSELDTFNNPLKLSKSKMNNDGFREELLGMTQEVIFNHISNRFEISNDYYKLAANNKKVLDWKKLKYSDRSQLIVDNVENQLKLLPEFKDVGFKVCSIPDNMSVADAKAYAGRPFLNDQDLIDLKKSKPGPIHFIGVYGNATETQAKNLLGYPDVSLIKDEFGLYVWEQNTHIQMVFLSNCRTPEAVEANLLLFNKWCKTTDEYPKILKRGNARYHILKSILEAQEIANKK